MGEIINYYYGEHTIDDVKIAILSHFVSYTNPTQKVICQSSPNRHKNLLNDIEKKENDNLKKKVRSRSTSKITFLYSKEIFSARKRNIKTKNELIQAKKILKEVK